MIETIERRLSKEPGRHIVQFYDAEPSLLVENVAGFIDEGLQYGDSILVIATPVHSDAFLTALGKRRAAHDSRSRRLTFLDAQATLDQVLLDGKPDWRRFEQIIGGSVRALRRARPRSELRAYGEMVGILWAAGQLDAAVQLQKFWNVLLGNDDFMLFCGYPIDVFAEEFDVAEVHDLLCAHTHVLPGGAASSMESALDRAIREVMGEESKAVSRDVEGAIHPSWGAVSSAEATILWLRKHQTEFATEILARARAYYIACA